MVIIPFSPSKRRASPVLILEVAPSIFEIKGRPYSLATTAPWDNIEPTSVTSPAIKA